MSLITFGIRTLKYLSDFKKDKNACGSGYLQSFTWKTQIRAKFSWKFISLFTNNALNLLHSSTNNDQEYLRN